MFGSLLNDVLCNLAYGAGATCAVTSKGMRVVGGTILDGAQVVEDAGLTCVAHAQRRELEGDIKKGIASAKDAVLDTVIGK